jgi:serine/threonine protein kinase
MTAQAVGAEAVLEFLDAVLALAAIVVESENLGGATSAVSNHESQVSSSGGVFGLVADAALARPTAGAMTEAGKAAPYLGSTVIVNAPAVPAPPMIGKYEIVDELGRGAMGVVYKAFDPGIGRTVALKVMSEQLARDTEFRERFLREARGAGILQHPNIVTVHELGEWQGAPFIAMEFLEGRSLEDILKNEKTTPLGKRLDIMAQVCRGLDYAHARGVVHRDIKPANVMVTRDGVAKIVDFGIARLADQKLTQVGHVLGTVSYMSPEQLQGKALDGRFDIFAVGVMLFEALTSVLPFAAEDTGSAIANILYRQPPNLSSFLANHPKELDEILKKCLAKDPAERFQTAGELADRLSRVQQELQKSQTAPTIIRSTSLASVLLDQPFLLPAADTPQPESVPKPPEKPSSRWAHSQLLLLGLLAIAAIAIAVYVGLRSISPLQPSRERSVATTPSANAVSSPQPSPQPAVPSATAPSEALRPTWPKEIARNQEGVYIATSSEAIPLFPRALSGYQSEDNKDFWNKSFPGKGSIRLFEGGDWQGIPNFPNTMNGCASGVFMIRWRSADPDVRVQSSVRYSSAVSGPMKAGILGYMSGSNCVQPMFKFADTLDGNTLVDVYYELKFWQAAP